MHTYFLFFLSAIFCSMVLTPVVRKLALKAGHIDKVTSRKIHSQAVPRLGGIAIFLSFMIPFAVFLCYQYYIKNTPVKHIHEIFAILTGGTFVLLIGVWDDIKGLKALPKVTVEIIAACIVYYFGVRINILSNPFSEKPFEFGMIIGLPFTILWIVGVTNAVNLSDGIDGLAAGLSCFIGIAIFATALIFNHDLIALISITLVGSVAGFLIFNFPPATIFMGDSGSLFLGFILASISILGTTKNTAAVALVIPILAMIVPLSDTVMSMVRRFLMGRDIMTADQDHIHHRLLKRGLSPRQTVIILYTVTIIFGFIALSTLYMKRREMALTLSAVGLLVIVLIRRLKYKEFKIKRIPETIKRGQIQREKTRQVMKVIKEFERSIKKTASTADIWKLLVEKVKKMGYTAVEVKPLEGTSLFRRNRVQNDPKLTDSFSFIWKTPEVEAKGINLNWYLAIPIYDGEKKIAELKVFKDEKNEAQKIHDEIMLELLCETVSTFYNSSKKH